MFRSIFWRLVASQVVVATFAVAAAGVLSYRRFRQHYTSAEERELVRIGRAVADLASPLLEKADHSRDISTVARTASGAVNGRVCIFGQTENDLLAAGGEEELPESSPAAVFRMLPGDVKVERTTAKCEPRQNWTVRMPVNSASGPVGTVLIRAPVEGTETLLHDLRRLSLWTVGGVGVGAFLLSLFLSRTIAAPMQRVSQASARIGDGDFSARVDPLPSGEVGALALTVNQMAERLEGLFHEVSAEKAGLEGVLGGMAEGVIAIDRDGTIIFANSPAEELVVAQASSLHGSGAGHAGMMPALHGLVGQSIAEVVPDQPWVETALTTARGSADAPAVVFAEGESATVRCHIRPLTGPAGGALVLLEDATKEHRLETMRRTFVANASHQLRTPLTGVRGYLEAVADGTADTPEARRRCVGAALEQLGRMQTLIEKLMDLSRFDAGAVALEVEAVRVDELLTGAAAPFQPRLEESGVHLETEADPELPPIMADGTRVTEALGNLIDNAIRVTPDGGRITVSAAVEGGAVRFSVADQGPGVAEEDREAVWERFSRGRSVGENSGGMGLGLAIVSEIAAAHGGEVFTANGDEGGAVFGFVLPINGPG